VRPPPKDAASDDERPVGRSAPRQFHAEVVYVELRDQILGGQVPAGQRLVEERLAEQFRTSRTPVREALRRLEGDGYLVRGSGGSLEPALPDVESMSEFYDVRIVIEELVVRRATQEHDLPVLEAIRDDWLAMRADLPTRGPSFAGPDFVYTDESFHRRLATASGNGVLARILVDLNDRIRTIRIHDFTTVDRVEATIGEHLEIIDAVVLGDAEAAAAFMRAHVQRSALVVRQRATDARTRMSRRPGGFEEAGPDEVRVPRR
jgi:DNA-binding GntR family transcriptional regulator